METIEAILQRKSVRSYTGEDVTDEQVQIVLKAAMAAPTTVGSNDYVFLVLRKRENIAKIQKFKPANAEMLEKVPVVILVCGDRKAAYKFPDPYWALDCSAATENILLAATDLGLGSLWLGIYPNKERTLAVQEAFSLPQDIIPLCGVAIGHCADTKKTPDRFDPKKVFYESL